MEKECDSLDAFLSEHLFCNYMIFPGYYTFSYDCQIFIPDDIEVLIKVKEESRLRRDHLIELNQNKRRPENGICIYTVIYAARRRYYIWRILRQSLIQSIKLPADGIC